jgi:hypothetical protein
MGKSKKTEQLLIRISLEDLQAIEKAATREGMTKSEFVRAAVLAYMALKFDKHALHAVLTGAREMMREFEEEAKGQFFAKRVKA